MSTAFRAFSRPIMPVAAALLLLIGCSPPREALPLPPALVIAYTVNFDFDSARITEAGEMTLRQAVQHVKVRGVSRVRIAGHTDTAGPAAYNMALSVRRAQVVRARLVALGIPTNAIAVIGKGETELLVQTADGVKEPLNRRAEILPF